MDILKGNESFDVNLMHSLSNLVAGDQQQSKFLVHGGWNRKRWHPGGVSKGPFDSRCDQTKQALTNKLADREKRLRSKELQMQRVLEAQPFMGSKVKHLFEI